jgi:hypothetical protein
MTAALEGNPRDHFERLSSPDPAVRLKACAHLLQIWLDAREKVPPAVVEALYRVLLDREASVRGVVQRWLIERPEIILTMTAEEKNIAAVTVSRAILKATDVASLRALTEIVGGLSPRAACQVLENAMDGDDAAAVANAAFVLGRINGYSGAAEEAMRHGEPVVRAAALFGVGDVENVQFGERESFVDALVGCLDEKGPLADIVRAKAAALVAPFRAVRVVRALATAHLHGDPATQHNARYAILVGGSEFTGPLAEAGREAPRLEPLVAEVSRLWAAASSPGSNDETHESQSPWFPVPVPWPNRDELEARGLV